MCQCDGARVQGNQGVALLAGLGAKVPSNIVQIILTSHPQTMAGQAEILHENNSGYPKDQYQDEKGVWSGLKCGVSRAATPNPSVFSTILGAFFTTNFPVLSPHFLRCSPKLAKDVLCTHLMCVSINEGR